MSLPPKAKPGPGFAFLIPYLKTYAPAFLSAVFFLSIEAACDLLQPTIMSKVIDRGIAQGDLATVLRLGLTMLAVAGAGALAASARNIISSRVSQRFGTALRGDLYRRIQAFSFADLERFGTASLVTRLTNDVTQVQTFGNGLMRIFVKAPLLAVGGIVMAVILDPAMSLVLVAVVPVVALLIVRSLRTSYPFYRRIQASLDRVNGVMGEYLSGVRVVKAFGRFAHEEARFAASNDELSASMTKAMRVMALFSPAITLSVNLGIGAVLWFGGRGVGGGGMHVGQVVAFVNYMTQILGSLMMLSFIFNMFVRARASAERIGEVLSLEGSEEGGQRPAVSLALTGKGPRVSFEAVSFRYDGAREAALKDLSLDCAPESTLGIIGSTGSGKTTLVSLLPRFHDASSGRILLDGQPVTAMPLAELRSRIAIVPQRSLLFTGSILDNIRWGRPEASLGEVEEAARAAAAHDFISSFAEGYETLLGRGGLSVSGGQRQRISIARALVRRPAILVLDDSTSAVDSVTEAEIKAGLRTACPGSTILLIAQRIASVRDCDLILVLDEGRVAGLGRHEDLMRGCVVYRDIWRSQVGVEAAGEALHG
jgi:ATP-binding cassette subfamily B protein